jgi:UDP:flavonoid glycosyltransferase YjiC (YdhE family)
MTNYKKALWFTLPAWGHTIPVARFASRFNGYRIDHTICSTGEWLDYFKKLGFNTVDYKNEYPLFPDVDSITTNSGIKTLVKAFERLISLSSSVVLDKKQKLEFGQFDLLFCDAVSLPIVHQIKQPHQKIVCYQTSIMLPPRVAKNIITRYKHTKVSAQLLLLALETIIYTPKILYLTNKFSRLSNTPMKISDVLNPSTDYSIALTSKYFQILPEESLNTYFIDPCLNINHKVKVPEKRAYISLGTMNTSKVDTLKPVIVSLIKHKYKISIKVPDNFTADWLGYENITRKPFFDQISELQQASLFVTHAGKNSCDEAIFTKTPTICIPQANDQFILAARMQELGLGEIFIPNRKESFTKVLRRIEEGSEFYKNNLIEAYQKHTKCPDCKSDFRRLTNDLGLDPISSAEE